MSTSIDDDDQVVYYNDLIRYLAARRPGQVCSVCKQDKGWKFHVELKEHPDNPPMTVFEVPVRSTPGTRAFLEVVCIECPNCGDLNYLSMTSILQFLANKDGANE